jgi:hypothetical protein
MKLREDHTNKIKQLLDQNECTSPAFILDLTAFIQDITDEAYEAGYYHRDQRGNPNYDKLTAWDRFPEELKRTIGGVELYDAIKTEIEDSKKFDLSTVVPSATINVMSANINVETKPN